MPAGSVRLSSRAEVRCNLSARMLPYPSLASVLEVAYELFLFSVNAQDRELRHAERGTAM